MDFKTMGTSPFVGRVMHKQLLRQGTWWHMPGCKSEQSRMDSCCLLRPDSWKDCQGLYRPQHLLHLLEGRSSGRERGKASDFVGTWWTLLRSSSRGCRELQVFGAIRPAGVMSHRLHNEWSASVLRLAQRLVTKSEPITVVNALRTSRELTEFMKARGRPPHSPDRVDLDAFFFSKTATSAPSRSLASLKWLNTNGQLQWDVKELTLPPQTNPRKKKGQAPVITPPMLPFLEEQAEAMCLVGDEKWTCLLAGWVIATGCLRHKHLVRTTPGQSIGWRHGRDWMKPSEPLQDCASQRMERPGRLARSTRRFNGSSVTTCRTRQPSQLTAFVGGLLRLVSSSS